MSLPKKMMAPEARPKIWYTQDLMLALVNKSNGVGSKFCVT